MTSARFPTAFKIFTYAFVLAVALTYALKANIDLSEGRPELFMDERITFDGVAKILHPESLMAFGKAVIDGGDHRYVRILWNISALASYIPEKIWGEKGQIIATRMLQVLLLSSAGIVFSFGILRQWRFRILLLLTTLSLPFSSYYMTMPKPEPLQLFFLAIFCALQYRGKLGDWCWLFAGLALGTKISTLPIIAVFMAANTWSIEHKKFEFIRILNKITYILIGLAIAVPILALPIILLASAYQAIKYGQARFKESRMRRYALMLISLTLVLIGSWQPVRIWIKSTILNTAHGADRANINIGAWIEYFFNQWLIAPPMLTGAATTLMVALIICIYYKNQKTDIKSDAQVSMGLKIIASGLILNASIMAGTHRLWGFYLYPGTLLFVVGLLVLLDTKTRHISSIPEKKWAHHAAALMIFLLIAKYWAPAAYADLKVASERTKQIEHTQKKEEYSELISFLNALSLATERQLTVTIDPALFIPNDSGRYKFTEFWGPYTGAGGRPDVIIFSKNHTPLSEPLSPSSPEYKKYIAEKIWYRNNVARLGAQCFKQSCFKVAYTLPTGSEILVLMKNEVPKVH